MKYKKVYIEITNNCNLNCSFCIHNKRIPKFMTMDEFKIVLSKLKGYTKYLYFHILGEPLLHPCINEFINEASKDFYVNITTNGYLIKNIKDNKNIRQINISLHSNQKEKEKYLENIFEVIDELKKYTYINYRLWTGKNDEIIKLLEKKYNVKIEASRKLEDNVFIDFNEEFTWPDLNNNICKTKGKCYALKDHIGILVDGTVIPCCLDGNGNIKLGNIFENNLEDIINSDRCQNMMNGFREQKLIEPLCKHCGFIDKLNKDGGKI